MGIRNNFKQNKNFYFESKSNTNLTIIAYII